VAAMHCVFVAVPCGTVRLDDDANEQKAHRRMTKPQSDARDRLLAQAMEHFTTHGVGDLSLRQMAEAIGTSHRMLIYHFDSKEGLLVEVVRALERHYQEMVKEWISTDSGVLTATEELRRIWRFVSAPERAPYSYDRLFYEIYGDAIQGRSHTAGFVESDVEAWLKALSEIFRAAGMSSREARDEARLSVAVFRGLILDFLGTGDTAAADRAMERYLSQCESRISASAPSTRRSSRRAS
jgi:AcrR family transcriptional regulator